EINTVTERIIGCAIEVHRVLRCGLFEALYRSAMAIEFDAAGLTYQREARLPAVYKGRLLGQYRIDFIVENLVIVEIKSVERVNPCWVKTVEKGTFPDTRRFFFPVLCNQCDRAPCEKICPTNALFKRDDGIVDLHGDSCIGCRACMVACPYDQLFIDPNTRTAEKCNFCANRVENELLPACVSVCPT